MSSKTQLNEDLFNQVLPLQADHELEEIMVVTRKVLNLPQESESRVSSAYTDPSIRDLIDIVSEWQSADDAAEQLNNCAHELNQKRTGK
ncbi:hypothetical protein OA39_05056 [Vibrio campbellii]|uniref:hypothetical protein n=1 Tax=Vibrio campbellii TaxID=680 RepID=UPI00053188EF|nr:hypothetical protein [Vibrio campbellii]KGR32586.1 hypothetical protein OA39_05056 [Vibrio campbellii]